MCWWIFTGLTHMVLEGYFVFSPEFYKDKTRFYLAEVCKFLTFCQLVQSLPLIDIVINSFWANNFREGIQQRWFKIRWTRFCSGFCWRNYCSIGGSCFPSYPVCILKRLLKLYNEICIYNCLTLCCFRNFFKHVCSKICMYTS